MPTLLPIVNEQDEVIGIKSKEACGPDDITRVSGLFVYNAQREILLSQRALSKRYDPGKWSEAVCGTVEDGETYESNILKEVAEEIGLTLKPNDIREVYHGLFEVSHRLFFTMYVAEVNQPLESFRLQADEVAELRWVTFDEFKQWVIDRPDDFTIGMQAVVDIVEKALEWGRGKIGK